MMVPRGQGGPGSGRWGGEGQNMDAIAVTPGADASALQHNRMTACLCIVRFTAKQKRGI